MTNTSDTTSKLRTTALITDPSELGLTPSEEHPRVWGALMELGYAPGCATLVAMLDGTVSLYYSRGGGVIGAGAHATARQAALVFLAAAERHVGDLLLTDTFPLPEPGRVRFFALTFGGVLTVEGAGEELADKSHHFYDFLTAGQAVISAILEQPQQ